MPIKCNKKKYQEEKLKNHKLKTDLESYTFTTEKKFPSMRDFVANVVSDGIFIILEATCGQYKCLDQYYDNRKCKNWHFVRFLYM